MFLTVETFMSHLHNLCTQRLAEFTGNCKVTPGETGTGGAETVILKCRICIGLHICVHIGQYYENNI